MSYNYEERFIVTTNDKFGRIYDTHEEIDILKWTIPELLLESAEKAAKVLNNLHYIDDKSEYEKGYDKGYNKGYDERYWNDGEGCCCGECD